MDTLKTEQTTKISKEEYNAEPVHYCEKCYSLKIMAFGDNDYCDKCGSTIIGVTDINSWEKLYKEKVLKYKNYGRK